MKNIALSLGTLSTLSLLATGGVAHADTATSNMTVSASVAPTCEITAGPLSFGAYNTVTGDEVDGTAAITVACTKDSTSAITLGQGLFAAVGSTDPAPNRRMKEALTANYLSYDLYQ